MDSFSITRVPILLGECRTIARGMIRFPCTTIRALQKSMKQLHWFPILGIDFGDYRNGYDCGMPLRRIPKRDCTVHRTGTISMHGESSVPEALPRIMLVNRLRNGTALEITIDG